MACGASDFDQFASAFHMLFPSLDEILFEIYSSFPTFTCSYDETPKFKMVGISVETIWCAGSFSSLERDNEPVTTAQCLNLKPMTKNYLTHLILERCLSWRPSFGRLLFVVILSTASFSSYAQKEKFVVNLQDASLKEVMRAIKDQSGYSFLYQDDLIAGYARRDFHIDTNGIDAVMKVILSGTHLTYEVEDGVVVLKPESKNVNAKSALAIVVKGVVKDPEGEALPGVNLLVKGTTRGTVTDNEGRYTITVEGEDVLIFSFIGFVTTEIPVNNQTIIDVVMKEDIGTLKEVVITGYQEIEKESFTGRSVTVSGEDLKRTNPVNVFQSIQSFDPSFRIIENNLAGSNPNRLPDITVRGSTGLPSGANALDRNNLATNPNLPTFILDGFEVSLQTVYDLDINRVASITLLKDAAATAIYGSRAANGVVVIVTKIPANGKLMVSYNYELTVSTPDLTPYNVLNAQEKLEYEYLAGVYDADRNGQAMTQDEYDELYYSKKRLVLTGVDSYWLSEPVETVFGHKNSVSVEGGAQTIRYGLTAFHQSLPGVMKESGRKRIGSDVYLSYNLKDKFLFRNTLSVAQVTGQESPYGSFSDYVKMNPYYPKRDEDGKIVRVLDEWAYLYNDEASGQNGIKGTDNVLNPLYNASLSSFNKSKYTQIINSFSTSWNITEGLLLKGLIGVTRYVGTQDIFDSPLSNTFYYYSTKDLNKRGRYYFGQTDQTSIDGNVLLSYNKAITNHVINASFAANLKGNTSTTKSFSARGFTNDRFDNISFANSYEENDSPYGLDETDRLVGALMAINYSFSDKYLLDLSGRIDGSSKFGSDQKYAPFWAAGIGWNLHKEKFITAIPFINQFRITASTGLTGGVSFPPYLGKTTYEYNNDWYSTGVGAISMGYGNDDLQWQRTQNFDLGVDLAAFDRRVTLTSTYYYKLTHDLIADIAVPPSLGFSSYKDNLGEMENKGFEIGLKLDVVRSQKWNVNLKANFTHNENKIKNIANSLSKYNDEADKLQEEEGYRSVPLLRYEEGMSMESIYAVPSLGIDPENGKEIYVKKDGTLTYEYDVKDITVVGNRAPTLYGFFGGTVTYKNFMLFLNFYTGFGGDQYNQTLVDRVENADPRYNVDQRVLDQRWKKPGDVTFYKDIADLGSTRTTSRFVQPDNVVELKTVSLTYDAPAALESKLRMQMLRFVVTMNDAWRWSAVEMERGIDNPFARYITFSVQTRF
jgi:TonB-linked SusC/RagA family outer membrane protein